MEATIETLNAAIIKANSYIRKIASLSVDLEKMAFNAEDEKGSAALYDASNALDNAGRLLQNFREHAIEMMTYQNAVATVVRLRADGMSRIKAIAEASESFGLTDEQTMKLLKEIAA